ncbi:hypothetical protein ACFVRU_52610 [Streptomyces sp. NPDC057927]
MRATLRSCSPAASPRSPTAACRLSTRSRCARWSARPSATSASPPSPAKPPADPALTTLRRVVDDLAASTYAIGELMLGVASACLSDTDAADVLALLCEEFGEPLEHGLAARRYAVSGDRRALHGTVL